MLRVLLVALVVAAMATGCTRKRADVSPLLWQEAEQFVSGPAGAGDIVGEKLPASGGRCLTGAALRARPNAVRYALDLPQPIADARVLLRYSRGMPGAPSRVNVLLTAGDRRIERALDLPATGGWGSTSAAEWRLAAADVGDLAPGKWEVALVAAGERNGDVNVDGFFIAPASIAVTAEELAAADRIHITGAGYVGLAAASTIIQSAAPDLRLVVRGFVPGEMDAEVALLRADGAAVATLYRNEALAATAEPQAVTVPGSPLAGLGDGAYVVRAAFGDRRPLDMPVHLVGELAATRAGRLAAIERTLDRLRAAPDDDPVRTRCLPDYEHAVEFIKAAWEKVESGQATAPLLDNLRRALDQYELTSQRLAGGGDPYADRRGDLRLAFRSAATGKLEPYRLILPDAYRPGGKTPLVLALNGDEDRFFDRSGDTIQRLANRRGYAIVSPRASSGYWDAGRRDLVQAIEHVLREFPGLDRRRVYATGPSAGGFGSYGLATAHPELLSAVACVAGAGNWRNLASPDRELIERYTRVPALILHGGSDPIVSVEHIRLLCRKLDEGGHPYELRIFPSYGHSYADHAEEFFTMTLDFFDRHAPKQ